MLDNIQAFLENLQREDPKKAAEFQSAVMLLASPKSIAVSSNEDVYLSANRQLTQSAGDSINISTQKNIVGHASQKISLFAAQEGARLFASQGKVEIQAQGDGLDIIARKGVQITSTEDTVFITSPTDINLTASGSQVKLNGSGIFPVTGGKFEVKAGQHVFMGGAKVTTKNPELAMLPDYYLTYIAKDLDGNPLKNKKYLMILQNGEMISGVTDNLGKTQKITTKGPQQIQISLEDHIHDGFVTFEEE
jgi:type VI secretion system secreted protein VgrG